MIRTFAIIISFIYSFLFTNLGRPFNAQHCSHMVPRWSSCSLENAGPASLSPRLAWGGIPKEERKKKNIKQKTRRLQAYQRMRQENRRRRRFISGDFIILSTFRLSLKCLYIPELILFSMAHNWQKIKNHFKIDF